MGRTQLGHLSAKNSTNFSVIPHLCSHLIVIAFVLFTKLPRLRDSEGTFRSSSQAVTCPPVYHTRYGLHTVPFIAERQVGKQ